MASLDLGVMRPAKEKAGKRTRLVGDAVPADRSKGQDSASTSPQQISYDRSGIVQELEVDVAEPESPLMRWKPDDVDALLSKLVRNLQPRA